ncbi:hypothetical protein [Nocardia sp. NPDC059239]|uniref:hypothetical protein n=1 Tax=unclassified Nocardia TaxID=2637762 RepID=UPI003694D349
MTVQEFDECVGNLERPRRPHPPSASAVAFYRVVLEFFKVMFRMAEDMRSIRNSDGGLRQGISSLDLACLYLQGNCRLIGHRRGSSV